MPEVRTQAGVIIPSTASVESVMRSGRGDGRGTVAWSLKFVAVPPPPGSRYVTIRSDRKPKCQKR